MDLLVSRLNAKLYRFLSSIRDPQVFVVDALVAPVLLHNFCFPSTIIASASQDLSERNSGNSNYPSLT